MQLTLMGIPLVAQVPASTEDYCLAAGITDAEAAGLLNKYHVYRDPSSQFRSAFSDAVEAQIEASYAREYTIKGEGDKAKKVYTISDTKWFDEVVCAPTSDYTPDSFKELAESIWEGISCLPSQTSGRIAQAWLDQADNYISAINAYPEVATYLQANLANKGVVLLLSPETNKPNQRELAIALKTLDEKMKREQSSMLLTPS